MEAYYRIFRIDSEDLKHQTGEYPLSKIIPHGPPFESKKDSKSWLKKNLEFNSDYFITRLYAVSLPKDIQKAKKDSIEQKS